MHTCIPPFKGLCASIWNAPESTSKGAARVGRPSYWVILTCELTHEGTVTENTEGHKKVSRHSPVSQNTRAQKTEKDKLTHEGIVKRTQKVTRKSIVTHL